MPLNKSHGIETSYITVHLYDILVINTLLSFSSDLCNNYDGVITKIYLQLMHVVLFSVFDHLTQNSFIFQLV